MSAGPGEADLWRVVAGRDLPFFFMNGTLTSCADAIVCGCASFGDDGRLNVVGSVISAARCRTDREDAQIPKRQLGLVGFTCALTSDLQILDSSGSGLTHYLDSSGTTRLSAPGRPDISQRSSVGPRPATRMSSLSHSICWNQNQRSEQGNPSASGLYNNNNTTCDEQPGTSV